MLLLYVDRKTFVTMQIYRCAVSLILILCFCVWCHGVVATTTNDAKEEYEYIEVEEDAGEIEDEVKILSNRVIVSPDHSFTRMANIVSPADSILPQSHTSHLKITPIALPLLQNTPFNADVSHHSTKANIQWSRFSLRTAVNSRVYGNIFQLTNPMNHFAILPPPEGCGSRADITHTMRESMYDGVTAARYPYQQPSSTQTISPSTGTNTAPYTVPAPTQRLNHATPPHPSATQRPVATEGHFGRCRVAANGGFFNTQTDACLGGLVSNGYTVQPPTKRTTHFGVTSDGYLFMGYLDNDPELLKRLPKERWTKTSKFTPRNRVDAVDHPAVPWIVHAQEEYMQQPDTAGASIASTASSSSSPTVNSLKQSTGTVAGVKSSRDTTASTRAQLGPVSGELGTVGHIHGAFLPNGHTLPSFQPQRQQSSKLSTSKPGSAHPVPTTIQSVTTLRDPNWKFVQLVSGLVWLVRDGKAICTHSACAQEEDMSVQETGDAHTFITVKSARTALGFTSDGRVLLVTVDGKSFTEQGVDLPTMAEVMVSLGAWQAVNLDGGGSAQAAVDGLIVNTPSDDGDGCPNGLDIYPGSKGDELSVAQRRGVASYWHRYGRRVEGEREREDGEEEEGGERIPDGNNELGMSGARKPTYGYFPGHESIKTSPESFKHFKNSHAEQSRQMLGMTYTCNRPVTSIVCLYDMTDQPSDAAPPQLASAIPSIGAAVPVPTPIPTAGSSFPSEVKQKTLANPSTSDVESGEIRTENSHASATGMTSPRMAASMEELQRQLANYKTVCGMLLIALVLLCVWIACGARVRGILYRKTKLGTPNGKFSGRDVIPDEQAILLSSSRTTDPMYLESALESQNTLAARAVSTSAGDLYNAASTGHTSALSNGSPTLSHASLSRLQAVLTAPMSSSGSGGVPMAVSGRVSALGNDGRDANGNFLIPNAYSGVPMSSSGGSQAVARATASGEEVSAYNSGVAMHGVEYKGISRMFANKQ